MFNQARCQTPFLILGLILSLSAAAEEHKSSDTQATAEKPAAAATKAKPETATATAAKPEAGAAATKTEPAAAKPGTPTATAERKPLIALAAPSAAEAAADAKLLTPAERKHLVAMAALSAAAAAAVKPATATPAVERKPVEVPVSRRPRVKPKVDPGLQRVALASKAPESPAAPVAAPAPHSLHWSYEGTTGPQAWAKLSPEFALCGKGERQSPIDIRDGMKLDLEPITFEYRPSGFKVIDNGHTIQANVSGWNSMRVMGRRFRLVQFHFHSPSEEMVDGRQYDMVIHLVHKDSEGRLGVVAVLVENGNRQPAIQAVLNNLPLEKGQEITASSNLDLTQILPENRRYYTYMGSLTTPPCSEDVLWIVMKQPVQATAEQLSLFSRMYPMNARPIQASSGRTIKESN